MSFICTRCKERGLTNQLRPEGAKAATSDDTHSMGYHRPAERHVRFAEFLACDATGGSSATNSFDLRTTTPSPQPIEDTEDQDEVCTSP